LIVTVRLFFSPVGHVIKGRPSYDTICCTPGDRPNGAMLQHPFDKRGVAAHRSRMQLLAIERPNMTVSGLAEPGRRLEYRVKNGREVAWRPRDDLKYLQGRGLLLLCLVQLAVEP